MTTSFEKLAKHANDIGINFVAAEIDLAFRLLDTASAERDEIRQERLRQEARDACDTALRCIPHLHLTRSQERTAEESLTKVRSRLGEIDSASPDRRRSVSRRNRPSSKDREGE